jgi:hypothetical protein
MILADSTVALLGWILAILGLLGTLATFAFLPERLGAARGLLKFLAIVAFVAGFIGYQQALKASRPVWVVQRGGKGDPENRVSLAWGKPVFVFHDGKTAEVPLQPVRGAQILINDSAVTLVVREAAYGANLAKLDEPILVAPGTIFVPKQGFDGFVHETPDSTTVPYTAPAVRTWVEW